MKKLNFIIALTLLSASAALGQGTLGKGGKQLNAGIGFSSWGTPVYVGVDFGVHEAITIGPKISYRNRSESYLGYEYSQSLTVISFNGNYHFNKLLNIPGPWDVYAGLTIGYYMWSDVKWNNSSFNSSYGGEGSGVGLDAQIGGRYFFSDKFGVNLELGGGTGSGGNFGITYKF
jgi:outer membrane immunogenic protein